MLCAQSNSQVLTHRDFYFALLLLVLTLILGSEQMVKGVTGVYHDDGIYVSTAKALAEGQGYRLINLPDTPAQTKYPPMYSIFLALIWMICPTFPDNLVLMQWFTLSCGGAFAGLAYIYLVRFGYVSRGVAAASAVITISATQFLYFSTLVLSDIPFALVTTVVLWRLEKQEEGFFGSKKTQFLLGGLLSLPFLTRTIGILFLPLAFYRMLARRRPIAWSMVGCALFLLPWFLWIMSVFRWNSTGSTSMYYTDYLTWWYTYLKPAFIYVPLWNLLYVALGSANIGVVLFNTNLFSPVWALPFVALLGLVIWGFVVTDMLKGRILPIFLAGYLLILLVWPWPPGRFLIPILPFLVAYFFHGMEKIFLRLPARFHPRKILLSIGAILITFNLAYASHVHSLTKIRNYPFFSPTIDQVKWESYEDIFDWILKHTEADDIIASGLDTMIYLYTGRQGFRPFRASPISIFYGQTHISPLGSLEEMVHTIKSTDTRYLVELPMPGFSEYKHFANAVAELREKRPGFLSQIYEGKDRRFVVYKIEGE
jgi:hypothetical protein